MYILNSSFDTCSSCLFSQECNLQYIKEAWKQERAVGERGMYCILILGSILKNTHHAPHCIMLHWGVSLHKYMCAVTMLQEGQGMMAYAEDALQHIFRLCFLLVRFNRNSFWRNVQHRNADFFVYSAERFAAYTYADSIEKWVHLPKYFHFRCMVFIYTSWYGST